ncbi:MAG: M28 family peptidase [Candidatus Zixiibacteriota bacterium]|jgi:hypothetical protein
MRRTLGILLLAAWAAAAWALPAEWLVLSPLQVSPAAEGLFYLGPASGGFLYNGSEEGLTAVSPYRVLDRGAGAKDYYIVWAPEWVTVEAEAFAHLGTAVRLSDDEILVGLERDYGPDDLRAVERRIELIRLAPAQLRECRTDAGTPPTEKDPEIEAAVNTISAAEFTSYIQMLLDVQTRYTPSEGYVHSTDVVASFFKAQGLEVTLFPFDYRGLTYYNVIGESRGTLAPDEVVVICGHLDSISEQEYREVLAPGADDNASGVAVVMTAARAFRELEFDRTVRYCAFGGEEQGLYGSLAYATHCSSNGDDIIAAMNSDMVAYDEENGARDDFSLAYDSHGWLGDYLSAVGGLYGNNLIYDHYEFSASDHRSFWAYGYPAIAAIEGRSGTGGTTGYPYYHTIEDTLDKLSPDLGARFARDFAATLAHLADAPVTGIEEGPASARGTVPSAHEALRVYPNPWHAGASPSLRFEGLSAPATVSVYDLTGRRVARWAVPAGTDGCSWRPTSADGEALPTGVYLYRVSGEGREEAGKIAILK